VIISDESGLDHVADEEAIPTRVTAQVTVSSVTLCYCAGHCQLSDSGIAQVTVSFVILVLRMLLSA